MEAGATLWYVRTRAEAAAVAALCQAGGLRAAFYHAMRSEREKREIEAAWLLGQLDVIVATNSSFGVGIDKPNVRLVLLAEGSGLHGALQQGGRAGRDGALALVVLLSGSLAHPYREQALPSAALEEKHRWCLEAEHAMLLCCAAPTRAWVHAGTTAAGEGGLGGLQRLYLIQRISPRRASRGRRSASPCAVGTCSRCDQRACPIDQSR